MLDEAYNKGTLIKMWDSMFIGTLVMNGFICPDSPL